MRPIPADRQTQRARLLALLVRARGGWVPLAEVQAAAGFQYGARVHECRHNLGLQIQNYQENGHSFFRLVPGPTSAPIAPAHQDSLFGDLRPEGSYPD
jgi:hypothetical protein